ncbi:B12-binding domain-containing radical SAM protein [Thermoproteota archaeon]
MKIFVAYPPLDTSRGVPLLSQNRQFQYFKEPTYIFPVVPASAVTMLSESGFDVVWKDCIAQGIDQKEFLRLILQEKPDVIAFETKTPVVKQHWSLTREIKKTSPHCKIILMGDHVTALPEESFANSLVDFVLTGGDYDFLLLNLCKNLNSNGQIVNPEDLEQGIFYRQGEKIASSGQFQLNHDLNKIPMINRDLVNWELYAYKNGNYKRTPGTYIMSGRDCWWGRCTFCSWPTLYPKFRVRSVSSVLDEIGQLIDKYKVREIMDDTGSFPIGNWLKEFCNGMISRGYHKKINIDCNMRFGALSLGEYSLMKKAGFRLVLFGLESANQPTLDRINKNLKVTQIVESCKLAKKAGLYPHITIMFGYPWESYGEALNTLNLGRWLLIKGYAHTVQATVVIPYPGSPLYEWCKENNALTTQNWDDFHMKSPVMKINFSRQQLMELVRGIYSVAYNPEFVLRRLLSIRQKDDIYYFARGFKKVAGHIFDFK